MLTIRFTRKVKKNQPFFKVVVIDKRRSSKGGRAVEVLGFVDPLTKRKSIDKERAQYWISKGAQPSDTVNNLFIEQKIIEGKKVNVVKLKKTTEAAVPATTAAAPEVAAPAPEAPKTETPAA